MRTKLGVAVAFLLWGAKVLAAETGALGPIALLVGENETAYVACADAHKVVACQLNSGRVLWELQTSDRPTGLAFAPDRTRIYVTCAAPTSRVDVIDLRTHRRLASFAAGHTAMSPVLSPDGKRLYVCNRFNHDVGIIDVASGNTVGRVAVAREPVAAALSLDGRYLFVGHHLHNGRAGDENVAAGVTVVETGSPAAIAEIRLPNGSGLVQDLKLSPDGKLACITHNLARYPLPTTQVDRGWMNTSACSFIDVEGRRWTGTVLLDSVDAGAAYPWGAAWSANGARLAIAHAGTHEISVIDVSKLMAKLTAEKPEALVQNVPNDLAYLVGLRERIKLPHQGPRPAAWSGDTVVVGSYFGDVLNLVAVGQPPLQVRALPLGRTTTPTVEREGERFFNDATLCFQGWQSCASCHSWDGRVDGLNWDLLNDGLGNPKNNKSLLLAHQTPPSMTVGIRDTAEAAVRAGIRHTLFTVQPEGVAEAIDAYLKSLRPVPSPSLVNGRPSPAAQRGDSVFHRADVGCAVCHPRGLFTDLQAYDVGTRGAFEPEGETYDTPTLVEVWRTAPYLHDGSARTVTEVLTSSNRGDRHGKTSQLTAEELQDLAAFVSSL